jgi:predicted DCC family thiol-disulfide oxidoreductase YuxK
MEMRSRLTVWYDGACPLCTREIALMRRLDRKKAISFVDVAQPQTVCPINVNEMLARFHAEENGVLLSGAAAFAAMWRAIPLLRPFGVLARNPLVLRALEWLYLRFLVVRPRITRWMNA